MPEQPKKRGERTVLEKMQIVLEANGLEGDELGALLRRHGIYQRDLEDWRSLADRVDVERPPSKEDKQRIKKLEKELRRKEKALAEAAALLVLQKKMQALMAADEDDDTKPNGDD